MPQPEDIDDLAFVLFRLFAQFEYCLKATGFMTQGRNGEASPDWTGFARSLPPLFEEPNSAALAKAVHYILEHPPKKQVIEEGRLAWSDRAPNSENLTDLVLLYVRRVRNNLFHGGKFNGHWFAPERSQQLMSAAVVILEAALVASPVMNEAFRQRA